jgi:transcriptional regulator with GAF, ATPase, and Fis domain
MSARVDAQALAASLRRLQERDAALLQPSLRRIVDACAQLFALDGSGVMLADEQGALRFVVTTDGAGRELEDAQRDVGQGPCLDTFVGDEPTSCESIRNDPRYPALAARLSGHAVDAVLTVPLRLSHTVVGTLNVHTADPRRWSRAERDALSRYGEIAEAMLSAAVSADQAGELAAQLSYALDYRAPIERGVGYLMARDGLDQDAAFHRLRTAARSNRRRIGEVAEDLLRSGRLPGEGPG